MVTWRPSTSNESTRPVRIAERRFSGLKMRRRAVLSEGSGKFPIPAAEVDQWRALARPGMLDDADEDGVVPAVQLIEEVAFEIADRAADEGHAQVAHFVVDAGEFVVASGGELRGKILLIEA